MEIVTAIEFSTETSIGQTNSVSTAQTTMQQSSMITEEGEELKIRYFITYFILQRQNWSV
jgi:hypothetical protein